MWVVIKVWLQGIACGIVLALFWAVLDVIAVRLGVLSTVPTGSEYHIAVIMACTAGYVFAWTWLVWRK